tara:strand:- start:30 stop:524 length:495 start_codon:yes stop_codon:yes gene_type:complete
VAKQYKDSLKALSFIIYFVILYVLWFVLSGYLKTLLLFLGLISVLFVIWMSYRANALAEDSLPIKLILKLPLYWLWLFKEIFKSGITTTVLIWNGKFAPELIRIKASQKSTTGIANYANAITLTPGTVTIEVDKNNFLVHALNKKLSEDLQSEDMDKVITNLDK